MQIRGYNTKISILVQYRRDQHAGRTRSRWKCFKISEHRNMPVAHKVAHTKAKFSAPVQTGPGVHPGYRVSFPGVKQAGRGVNHPQPSSTEVKERAELHIYSPSGPSWPVLERNLPLRHVLTVSHHISNDGKIGKRVKEMFIMLMNQFIICTVTKQVGTA